MNYGAHESQLGRRRYLPAKHPLSPNGPRVSPPTSLSAQFTPAEFKMWRSDATADRSFSLSLSLSLLLYLSISLSQ